MSQPSPAELSLQDKKLIYRARRGLKELDFYLVPYIDKHFADATPEDKLVFADLVEQEDPDLLDWFIGVRTPEDTKLAQLIDKIRSLKSFD